MENDQPPRPPKLSLMAKLAIVIIMISLAVGSVAIFNRLEGLGTNSATGTDSVEYTESDVAYKLAAIDLDTTSPDDDSIDLYADLLDSISTSCGLSRLEIGDMAAYATGDGSPDSQQTILSFLTILEPLAEGRGSSTCEDAAGIAANSPYG